MYHEFMAPYFSKMAAEFGLVYYGCCEPVELYWDQDISKYPNLRKVSISPWCNEEMMAERLSKGSVIYSRKPSPNFLGVQAAFDEEAFRSYIRHTAKLTKDCHTEYVFRDIYKLYGNIDKVKRAVEIGLDEYNPYLIVRIIHGVLWDDYQWIKFPGDTTAWEDVKLRD